MCKMMMAASLIICKAVVLHLQENSIVPIQSRGVKHPGAVRPGGKKKEMIRLDLCETQSYFLIVGIVVRSAASFS